MAETKPTLKTRKTSKIPLPLHSKPAVPKPMVQQTAGPLPGPSRKKIIPVNPIAKVQKKVPLEKSVKPLALPGPSGNKTKENPTSKANQAGKKRIPMSTLFEKPSALPGPSRKNDKQKQICKVTVTTEYQVFLDGDKSEVHMVTPAVRSPPVKSGPPANFGDKAVAEDITATSPPAPKRRRSSVSPGHVSERLSLLHQDRRCRTPEYGGNKGNQEQDDPRQLERQKIDGGIGRGMARAVAGGAVLALGGLVGLGIALAKK